MTQLVKRWPTGTGNLSVTYDGYGDGAAVFTSDVNEGVDRELTVTFEGDNAPSTTRKVVQAGKRHPLILADGAGLYFSDGKRAIVIKEDIEDE